LSFYFECRGGAAFLYARFKYAAYSSVFIYLYVYGIILGHEVLETLIQNV